MTNEQGYREILSFDSQELDVYSRLTGSQLRRYSEEELGIFIAESPTVIKVALEGGCEPISLLTDSRLIEKDEVKNIIDTCRKSAGEGFPVYTAKTEILKNLVGFELTRGALCAMKRPKPKGVAELCRGAKRIAVLENIADSTNIGAIFRSAAALGIDAVLTTPSCCDVLCRRAVRVSMGTVFLVPFGQIGEGKEDWPKKGIEELHALGFKTCAMALSDNSVSIEDEALTREERLAIILGTEGTGLTYETVALCDYTVKIPMARGVDSLNVAAAGAIAFWQLTRKPNS